MRLSVHICERVRYAREPQLRAAWHLRARRARGDARPDDDAAPRRGGARPPDDDAHALDASVERMGWGPGATSNGTLASHAAGHRRYCEWSLSNSCLRASFPALLAAAIVLK